jgi:hypothetical protein
MDVIQYIQQRRSMGVPDAQIRQELLANGWMQPALDQAFAQLNPASTSPSLPPIGGSQSPIAPHHGIGRKMIAIITVVILLVVGALVLSPRLLHKQPVTSTKQTQQQSKPAKTTPTDKPTQQSQQAATERRNGVNDLVSKLNDYLNNNNGTMPAKIVIQDTHHMLLCDATCSTDAATKVTLGIDVSGVELHQYRADLKVPNDQAIYVVPGAACNQKKTDLTTASSRSIAILYQAQTGSKTFTQECVAN